MKEKIYLLVLAVLVMLFLIGCGQVADTLSDGGTGRNFVITFKDSRGNLVKTTGIKVELVKKDSHEVLVSTTTNDEESITLNVKISFEDKTYFFRVTFTDGRVQTSHENVCRGGYGNCPDCINFTVII